jgi:hypothetical protein
MSSRFDSVLLRIGGLGHFLGFASYVLWAGLVILSFAGILTYDDFRIMSGIFFQAPFYRLIFNGLLSLSLLFSAIGCFALWRRQNLSLGFVSGVFFFVTFVSSVMTYGLSFATLQSYAVYAFFLFPLLFFLGLILWGVTLLSMARKISVRGARVGILIVASGGFGMLLWQAIRYWGFELWLLSFGWLYAIGALMSAVIFFRISRMIEKPMALVAR